MASKYDLIVIGSGPGGYVAAIRAAQLGMKVGVVEKAELGGVCLNWGCIPTKALLKSAQVFEYINHSEDYGIKVKDAKADFGGMVKRSRDVAGGMSKGIQFLFKKNKIDHIAGHGTLKKGKKVEVKAEDGKVTTYDASHVILATGGRARELPNLPIDGEKVIEYRKAMVLEKQPKKMVIVGSGAIGVEFAYFYNSIGTEVTIVEYMDRIVPVEDVDVSKQLERTYKKSGVKIMTNSEVIKVDTKGTGCKVTVKTKKGEEQLECDVVLSAVGVATNLENLGLEEVGVKTEKGKVLIDEYYKTNVEGVYAIGDIVKGQALAHVASAEGIICVEKINGMHVT
ncbi:MAG: FAD-dependent oxidoreductase, partial [Bacteroidota bacterium]